MNLIRSLLKRTSDMMMVLNTYNPHPRVSPEVLLASSIIMVFLVAFSRSIYTGLLGLFYLLFSLALLRPRMEYYKQFIMIILLLGVLPGIPLVFSVHGNINSMEDLSWSVSVQGFLSFLSFSLRVVSSSLIFLVPVSYLGWRGFSRIFYRPRFYRVYLVTNLVFTSIPLVLRYMYSLLLARESRSIRDNLSIKWRMLSSVVGDMLVSSAWIGNSVGLAVEARTFTAPLSTDRTNSDKLLSYLYLVITIVFVITILLVEKGLVA